jgi:hypothetical protein
MSAAASYLYRHFCRVRMTVSSTQWAVLVWLTMQGEQWRSRVQVLGALPWIRGKSTRQMDFMTAGLIARGLVEKRMCPQPGGRCRWEYRITPAGVAFLKLPQTKEEQA